MIQPTYRRLDQAAKIGLFSFGQWVVMLLLAAVVIATYEFLPLPHPVTLIAGGYILFVPGALMAMSEGERPPLWRSLRDILHSTLAPKAYEPGPGKVASIHIRPTHGA